VNICEMKFSESEFTVDADCAKKLRQKKEVFQNVTKTRKTIFTTMITTFGIIGNSHSRDIISNELTMECLF
ncbi:MAG: ATP-binding protein, partial [Bacteroidota bacterium]